MGSYHSFPYSDNIYLIKRDEGGFHIRLTSVNEKPLLGYTFYSRKERNWEIHLLCVPNSIFYLRNLDDTISFMFGVVESCKEFFSSNQDSKSYNRVYEAVLKKFIDVREKR